MNVPPSMTQRARYMVRMFACVVSLILGSSQVALGAEPSVEQLRKELRQRDAAIADLLKRVAELERRIGLKEPQREPAAPVTAATPRTEPKRDAPIPEGPTAQPAVAAAEKEPQPAPGAVEVDELAAERALERTLTTQGVLLLPAKAFEIEPFFTFNRRDLDEPSLTLDETVVARGFRTRRNEYDLGLRGKFGLPFDSQAEVSLPYRIVEQDVANPGDVNFDSSSRTGSSQGDIRLGLAKTLVRERGWRPDLVGRVAWDTATGDQFDDDIALGIGFHELQLSLTALKRQDPLAFSGTLSYEKAYEKNDINPGDEWGATIGVSLAASPQTALSAALVQRFISSSKVDGRRVSGSDRVSGSLLLGASVLLGRQTLLSVNGNVGLTDDAPDYGFSLALPTRF
ncbi:MAG: transporter [Gammaproteobacteria bacterium]|nr:transporter [Gammaproteobacteria bacterium]MDJ0891762.1 transporter [Gammaproteobacteria bacterium]